VADVLSELEVDEQAMKANLASLLKGHEQEAHGAASAMIERALADWTTSRGTGP
jgi:hypothetical protein